MFQRGHKSLIRGEALVPPAELAGKRRGDVHLVDGCIKTQPGKAFGKTAGIGRKEFREVRVLEVFDPVGYAEVAQVDDRCDAEAPQLAEGLVRERPIIPVRTKVCFEVRHAVAQVFDAQIFHQRKVLPPAIVEAGLFHFVDTFYGAVGKLDRWVAVLDARGEHKLMHFFHRR